MYGLIKDFLKTFIYGSGMGMIIMPFWSLIQFFINIFIKIFITFPLFLFGLVLAFTNKQLSNLFSNTNNPTKNITKCKLILGLIFSPFAMFWIYCAYAVAKSLPFANQLFIQNIKIFGISPTPWWCFMLIAIGYILLVFISITEELGLYGCLFTLFNVAAFNNQSCQNYFVNTSIILFIFCSLYLISKFYNFEFRSVIMEDIEADQTLKGHEKWSYYLNKRKKW